MTAIKQNNKYIETKLKHNLENFTKTLHDEELSFVRITELFNKEQKKYVCGKTVSSENNVKIEQDVQDVIQNITRVTKDVHEIKEFQRKICSNITSGWEEISSIYYREENANSTQVHKLLKLGKPSKKKKTRWTFFRVKLVFECDFEIS